MFYIHKKHEILINPIVQCPAKNFLTYCIIVRDFMKTTRTTKHFNSAPLFQISSKKHTISVKIQFTDTDF